MNDLPPMTEPEEIELDLLLDAIHRRYHYDFRSYSRSSLRRRAEVARQKFGCETLSSLQSRILREPDLVPGLIDCMTVQVSEMFRDPEYFRALREEVIPHLKTFPSLKVWVAGCSNGEELYSLAILFREEGLEARTMFYATDINPAALDKAQAGIYELDRIALFSENHRASGGRSSLSEYYTAGYGRAVFDKSLRARTLFAEHSLASDAVFSEMHLISCRNVLIYFDAELQERAFGLFYDSLVRGGFLGLGANETLRFSKYRKNLPGFSEDQKLYRRAVLSDLNGDLDHAVA